jgi:triacylglycerol lipase
MSVPVVLSHGLLGFYHMTVNRLLREAYYGGIREDLRAAGHQVFFPQVPGMGSVPRRAAALAEQIDQATKSPVFIIAHSMGGLDARYLIAHLGFGRRVVALATIATPHRGSAFADWGVNQVGKPLRAFGLLSALRIEHAALHDLTSQACQEFNARTPDHPDVTYVSVTGKLACHQICPLLRIPYRIIAAREGPNDGLVSVQSAKWGRFLGLWPIDHIAQVNLPTGSRLIGRRRPDPIPYYRKLLDDMIRLTGGCN